MWKVIEHKTPTSKQDLELVVMVKQLAKETFATYYGELESAFNSQLKQQPKSNSFSPESMYRLTQRNLKSAEVWKLHANGDFKHKMFTLVFTEKQML